MGVARLIVVTAPGTPVDGFLPLLRGELAARGVGWEDASRVPEQADGALVLLRHRSATFDRATLCAEHPAVAQLAPRVVLDQANRTNLWRLVVELKLGGALEEVARSLLGRSDVLARLAPGVAPSAPRFADGFDPTGYTYVPFGLRPGMAALVADYLVELGKLLEP